MRHIISILMENEAGALSRVAGLFSARGYNIESLTVAPTEDPSLLRMTLVTTGVYRDLTFDFQREYMSQLLSMRAADIFDRNAGCSIRTAAQLRPVPR